jgi:hypothetical protein
MTEHRRVKKLISDYILILFGYLGREDIQEVIRSINPDHDSSDEAGEGRPSKRQKKA